MVEWFRKIVLMRCIMRSLKREGVVLNGKYRVRKRLGDP